MSIQPIASTVAAPSFDGFQGAGQVSLQRQLRQAVNTLNQAQAYGPVNELTFSFDAVANQRVLQVVNKHTREVQFQVPPEYVLRMAAGHRQK